MIAYLGNPQIKTDIIAQLEAHRRADQIVKGQYWQNGKGCAVGCTIHSGQHSEYEPRFGIPSLLAGLEDCIFEGLPNDRAMDWPVRFMSAVPVGADLEMVWPRFALWMLDGLEVKEKDVIDAIAGVRSLYVEWLEAKIIPSPSRWDAAARAAWAAGGAWAARAARGAGAAWAAWAAEAAEADAQTKFWISASDKLIELLEACAPEIDDEPKSQLASELLAIPPQLARPKVQNLKNTQLVK